MVITTMKDGVWWLTPTKGLNAWTEKQIDSESSGFEHAAGVADMNADGVPELYVASDNDDAVRVYEQKDDGTFSRKTIYTTDKSDLTWAIEACL